MFPIVLMFIWAFFFNSKLFMLGFLPVFEFGKLGNEKSYLLLFLCLILCPFAYCQSYYIYTVAGNGNWQGSSGDGGSAIDAVIVWPYAVAVNSSSGNIYITDTFGNRIRLVFTNGTITTIAGNGDAGYSGDGQPATQAKISQPQGISLSKTGDIYIADTLNNCIRILYSNGTIDTFAGNSTPGYFGDGGYALNAELNEPSGVFWVETGDVYIADTNNNRIRLVFPNGTITTFAGTGVAGYSGDGGAAINAQLNSPTGVAISSGEVYIADYTNNRVRRVSSKNIISTIAGNGLKGYLGDGGLAINAELYYPSGISISSSGEIYIADYFNNVIRNLVSSPSEECLFQGYFQSQKYCLCGWGYLGSNCQYFSCYGKNSTHPDACSGSGTCQSLNNCTCDSGYTGFQCQLISCYGLNQTTVGVCSGRGVCQSANNCSCNVGYTGKNCEINICYGIKQTSASVCSGHGKCQSANNCICYGSYIGLECQFNKNLAYLFLLFLLIPIVGVLVIIIWLFKNGYFEVRRRDKKE
jgi:hypothetical protein